MRKSRSVSVFILLYSALLFAQTKPLTVEWINSEEGSHIARLPSHVWLSDGSAILYNENNPHRTFEHLNPANAETKPILDMAQAMSSLKQLAPDSDVKDALPWPSSFDAAGQKAVYVIKNKIYLLDLAAASFTRVTNGDTEDKNPGFSPDGKKLAFVRANDIYVYDIASRQEKRLTTDGSATTLNGTLSWVYWEEIMGRRDIGYWWSPDSTAIAYLQTDESKVPVSTFVDFSPVDQRIIHQAYPKAGEHNPDVRVGVIELNTGSTKWLDLSEKPYEWLIRVNWLPDSKSVSVETLDRSQTELRLRFADRSTGAAKTVLTETDPGWVNVTDDLYFMKDGRHFLWTSERTGYMHLYLYRIDGTLENQVTKGEWALASSGGLPFWVHKAVVGVDEKNNWIYFTSLKESSVERHLYRIKTDGSEMARIDVEPGSHGIDMSPTAQYYFDTYSTIRSLPVLQLHVADGKVRDLIAGARTHLLTQFDIQYPELITVPAADGFQMPGQILKPKDFNPSHKYPVIMYVYGGPSAPTVKNGWSQQTLFNNILLQNGYVCFGVDNRAATGISKKLENTLKENPSVSETADLVAAVRWLKAQPWVDPDRVGVWGWSGGGTNTLNLMTRSKEFKAGISGAPVTDWRYYDSKWGEAIAGLPQDNPKKFDDTSLVKRAGELSGTLMLMYGTYDDNVHPQNEEAFEDALIKAGKPYIVVSYPMRKHGFVDTPAKIHRDKAMIEFWKQNL